MLTWQDWITKNYTTISHWARKWHKEEPEELLAFLTLYLEKNWHKFSQIPDGEQRIKFLQTWMKNNVSWSNSDFRRSISVNNFPEDIEIVEEPEFDDSDIMAEDIGQDVKDFIKDLHRRFSEEEVYKIISVRKSYLILQTHERVLYDLWITQMLSIRAVAKRLNLPSSAVWGMINDLKKKIKSEC